MTEADSMVQNEALPDALANKIQQAAMTARESLLCDCPEPCDCYAAGKAKALSDYISNLAGHAQDCTCQPCQFRRTWFPQGQDNRN